MALATAILGCGQIVEVPVATTSETEATGSETTAAGDSTAEDTKAPDIDEASTSAPAEESSTGGEPPVPEPTSFCIAGRQLPLELADDGTPSAGEIAVAPPGGVIGLQVNVRATHPRVSDLRLTLRAPDGTAIALLDEPACELANVDATFLDGAEELGNEQCLEGTTEAITGPVRALDDLDALLGSSLEGTWVVEAVDAGPEAVGTVDQVCVVLLAEVG